MKTILLGAVLFVLTTPPLCSALDQSPAELGRPPVTVSRTGSQWTVAGKKITAIMDQTDFTLTVQSGTTSWKMHPSVEGDITVAVDTTRVPLRFASARKKEIVPYSTGYSTGLKITLSGFSSKGQPLDFSLQLFLTLESPEEELVCTVTPGEEHRTAIKECLWPKGFATGKTDATVVPFMQGMLLPGDWPRKVWLYDSMSYGRGLYMPWWGHQRGNAAALVILETPDDGGCVFDHPAGGPTGIAPRWTHSLGTLRYSRTLRMCFMEKGTYVDLAKRYRRYVIENGHFLPLSAKIARTPDVAKLIGSPVAHFGILYHIQEQSSYYDKTNPKNNHQLVTFDERAKALQGLRDKGVERCYVHLDGWGFRGYDNLHPDVVPPSPDAGDWAGMKRFADACDRLGFVFALHDQYRDYYHDAPSYDPARTILEENNSRPFGNTWYGGDQSILCPRLAPGFVMRNHRLLKERGIKVRGSYLDVFAVVPPDECYNPEHPATRTDCLRFRAECFSIIKSLEGVVSSEEPADWAIPYLDLVHHGPYALDPNPGKGPAMGIPVPLFNLVYHDAIILPWSMGKGEWGIPETDQGWLHGLLNGGIPYISLEPGADELARVRALCALHQRVALLEMTDHEFLDASHRIQRTTFAGRITVTVDFDRETVAIKP